MLEASEHFDETSIEDHPSYGHNPDDIMPVHKLFPEDTIEEERNEQQGPADGEVSKSCERGSRRLTAC